MAEEDAPAAEQQAPPQQAPPTDQSSTPEDPAKAITKQILQTCRECTSSLSSDASALRSSGRVVAVGIDVLLSDSKVRIIVYSTSSSRETRALEDFPAVCEEHFIRLPRVVSRKRCQTNLTRCHVWCAVTKGLASLCKEKPEQPVRWLAEWLRMQSPLDIPPLSLSPYLLFDTPPSSRSGL